MTLSNNTRQSLPWLFLLLLLATSTNAQGLIDNRPPDEGYIVIDGFVDTKVCHQHLVEADANGNNDGKLQADEYLQFAQSQTPSGELDQIPNYQSLPLVMQATFVTLTCLCRDERFGGDPRDVNCCLGVDAHIALVGNDVLSTSQERTRLFATCFLTDQAIQQVLGSDPPSFEPTESPSIAPTPSPTFDPTDIPTGPPTTSAPTLSPTTEAPTTPRPTMDGPTIAPTSEAPTTSAPTDSPTLTPTAPPLLKTPAQAVYTIAVENGAAQDIDSSQYEPDLIAAMDQLATQVVGEVFATSKRRRSLQVIIELPTSIAQYEATNCTAELVEPGDRCENVQHMVVLLDSAELTQTQVQDFEAALIAAITRGDLQANLPSSSIVTILTGMPTPTIDPDEILEPLVPEVDSGLSGAATAGIVIASLAVVTVLPLCFYVAMRNNHDAKQPYGGYEPHDAGSGELEPEMDIEATTATKGMTPKAAASMGTGTLGASPGDYGKTDYRVKDVSVSSSSHSSQQQQQPIKQVQKVPPLTPERDGPPTPRSYDDHDSSSNAGSSGWSSSAGLSSLNTGSAEDSMDLLNSPQGATLAAIGAASGVVRKMDNRRKITVGGGIEELEVPPGAVSRNDLDNAIEAGDWAAVGATAALLAAASDSQSASSKSRASRASRSQATSVSSVDAARAAELDHLVDAGDWEGVVLAAAKFEAQEGSVRSGTASSVRSSSVGSETRSGTGSGTFTPSVSTSVSESASKAQKRQEIRAQVEALVRRVVPEELDNVDEMMLQFKGREEELVETLRTMQERAVAQKARSAGHKAAKQEARRTVQRGGMPPPVIPPSAAPDSTAPASSSTGRDVPSSSGGGSDTAGSQHKRTALQQAIEAGDWEAVGEAAALMSDASMASGSTAEVQVKVKGSLRLAGVNADRARELDEMIDRGDWSGVVEAAGRFNQADKEASGHSSKASRSREPDSADLTAKRNKQLKEEEDALAQAEIWMQIAQQSKVPGATDAAASDAADWAIARSLKSLKKAEQGSGSMSGGGHKGDSDQAGADDDESV